jgi:hypothetical protein
MAIPECMQGLIECRGGLPVSGGKSDPVKTASNNVAGASNILAGAQEQQSTAKQRIKSAGKALVKIARDILGVDAALDCVSSGDMGACGETLLNIAGSFAGGLAGKILAKYGAPWNWAKGAKLAKRVVGLVGDLIGGVKDLWKANKAVDKAKDGLSKAKDALAAAKKKAAQALKKKPECHSFLPGTKVLLSDGSTKPIEDVELGDKVTVTDSETGETTVREVAGTIVTEDDKHFVDLTITSESGTPEALIATTTHPFWVASEGEWIKAGDLRPGMTLRTPAGDTVEVTDTRHFEKRQRTHDLTVTGIHAYYVLAATTPLLVHNCDLTDYADSLQPKAGKKSVQYASEYTDANGKKFYGHNESRNVEDLPAQFVDAIGERSHYGCAEVGCLLNAYNSAVKSGASAAEAAGSIRGGSIRTVFVFNQFSKDAAKHATPASPCFSKCDPMLKRLGIDF